MVPMLYSLYLVVLFHLPVAAYYPHTASMTAHELQGVVITILVYAAIELVSFSFCCGGSLGFRRYISWHLCWRRRVRPCRDTSLCGLSLFCI
ncbi:hypothetical protein JG688_00017285 [Phytophthora aleatoria]|uniref:Secreted peptide n=1 Tax=Phytophthora aleatoria TaxID=2496075 RepID=A0A8J5ICQ3_9STRA|nr:hypothetical protein JG688_00017285 [Phytophthora aleatoria]